MTLPIKHSIAVMILNQDRFLATRRAENDDELPGIWGLPAATFREGETLAEIIARIGWDKLGVMLSPIRQLVSGTQPRTRYRLEMELWEVAMSGTPNHPQWQWASVDLLRQGMTAGSLCCELAIQSESRAG